MKLIIVKKIKSWQGLLLFLKKKLDLLQEFAKWLEDKFKKKKDDVSASCNDFLKTLGYIALGFAWLKMTKVSIINSE